MFGRTPKRSKLQKQSKNQPHTLRKLHTTKKSTSLTSTTHSQSQSLSQSSSKLISTTSIQTPLPSLSSSPSLPLSLITTTTLLTSSKRFFRGGTLGLGFTKTSSPTDPTTLPPSSSTSKPVSISSRFRRGDDDEQHSDNDLGHQRYNHDISETEHYSEFESTDHSNELVVPVNPTNDGVISPKNITSAVHDALQQALGKNLQIDPNKIKILTPDEALRELSLHKSNNNNNTSDNESQYSLLNVEIDPTKPTSTSTSSISPQMKQILGQIDGSVTTTTNNGHPLITTSNSKKIHSITDEHNKTQQQSFNSTNNDNTAEVMSLLEVSRLKLSQLSSPEIVAYLDSHVIAQEEAKKALAMAVRNRERRFRLNNISKPDSISTIEEIGIRLAQKHGYTLRQELFEQIGKPTVYNSNNDPSMIGNNNNIDGNNNSNIVDVVNTINNDDNNTVTTGKGKKTTKKQQLDTKLTSNDTTTTSTTTTSTNTINTKLQSTQISSTTPISDGTVKEYLLERSSNLTLQDTIIQNQKLFQNNQKYGSILAKEVNPFNILMVGPTGSGKTELVKRLSTLLEAPYVHADATRYTESGVVGADVDQILVDLYKDALDREKKMEIIKIKPIAVKRAIAAIVNAIRVNDSLFQYLESKGLGHLLTDFNVQTNIKSNPFTSQYSSTTNTTNNDINDMNKTKGNGNDAAASSNSNDNATNNNDNGPIDAEIVSETPKATTKGVKNSVVSKKATKVDDKPISKKAAAKTTKSTTKVTKAAKTDDNDVDDVNSTPKAATKSTTKTTAKTTPTTTTTKSTTKAPTKAATKAAVKAATTTKAAATKTTTKSKSKKDATDDDVKVTTATKAKKTPTGKKAPSTKPTTVTAHTIDESKENDVNNENNDQKGDDSDLDAAIDALIDSPPSQTTITTTPSSQTTTTTTKKSSTIIRKGKGEKEYPEKPSENDQKLQTTPYDDDASGLFSTDVDDESSFYHKTVKPLMFQNLSKKYLNKDNGNNNKDKDGITSSDASYSKIKRPNNNNTTNNTNNTNNNDKLTTFIPTFDDLRKWIEAGYLNDYVASIPIPVPPPPKNIDGNQNTSFTIEEVLQGNSKPKTKMKTRRITVADALQLLTEHHSNELVKDEELHERALKNCEQNGVIFIDEIDKLIAADRNYTTSSSHKGEGVQRELLSLLQGKVVQRNGLTIKTENILFICAGAFHHASPAQLLPELQGRLPVVTKLNPLTQIQLALVLTLPIFSILKQYITLMKADGVEILIDDESILEMAKIAAELNERTMNLGARRLHNIINSVFGYISYNYANGLRLQVDDLGRLQKITTNEQNENSYMKLYGNVLNIPNGNNTTNNGQRLVDSKSATNTLSMNIPIEPKYVNILPNGETSITITKEYVQKTLKHMADKIDISKFLL